MALGIGKIAVLESKLDIYEELSKEMLDKLEKAVGTISENSNKIAIILERHENRLDESERSDQLILKMLEEIKEKHDRKVYSDFNFIGFIECYLLYGTSWVFMFDKINERTNGFLEMIDASSHL